MELGDFVKLLFLDDKSNGNGMSPRLTPEETPTKPKEEIENLPDGEFVEDFSNLDDIGSDFNDSLALEKDFV